MKHSKYAKVFKALSSEQRLNIFLMIYNYCQTDSETDSGTERDHHDSPCKCMEKTFTKVSSIMTLSRSTISHHLKELQNAGLIRCERNGQSFNCSVNKELLNEVRTLFD